MELANTRRTCTNVIKYLSVYEEIKMLTDQEIISNMQLKECITLTVFDKVNNKKIIACISKHSSQTTKDNKLIKKLCRKIDFTPIESNIDILFIIYDTDADDKIEKHKKKVKDYEKKYQADYTKYHVHMKFLSYNKFRFTLDELMLDRIVRYELIENEEELMIKNGIQKGHLPIIYLDDDPSLLLMHVKVGQIVREIMFNKSCGEQIMYKRVV